VDTVYFGGGTPPLVGADRLEKIVRALHGRFEMPCAVEFTLEVTPGSADPQFLVRALGMGMDRLSIGAQSFQDQELRAVGRLHSARDTQDLVRQARSAGFANLSIDLVAGLPHQTRESWRGSLEAASRLAPQHISLYLFEIDEKSRLDRAIMLPPFRAKSSWPTPTRRGASGCAGKDTFSTKYLTLHCLAMNPVTT
jgi:oxygen-independent coproporphyrinogen-3 oxidase